MEHKQLRVLGSVVEIVCRRLLLRVTPRLIHIQYQVKEPLHLPLIQRELLWKAPQFLQHLPVLLFADRDIRTYPGEAVIPAHIQKFQIDVPALQLAQLHHGGCASLPVSILKQTLPALCDPTERWSQFVAVHFQKRQQALQEREFLVGRGNALDPVAIKLENLFFLREVHLGIPHVGALQNRQS